MSGFVAVVNTDGAPVDRPLLQDLTASLYFRGPDRQQVWTGGSVGLVHTLFATTREARLEQQPATLDGLVWITGCIRIDAREELVSRLGLQRSLRLEDTPDSHLVLHAYGVWGEQCLAHLLGDFAFALWDNINNTLFCARDRFGLRQLVYAQRGATFVAGNSIHSLLRHPGISDRLSEAAIGDFLLFGDHRWGDRSRTAFEDICALEPAHCLVLDNGRVRTRRYWDAPHDLPPIRYRHERDYAEHFEELLRAAVSDRLRSRDVVVSLSGGMDSTSVAATVRDIQHRQNGEPVLHATTVLHDSVHASLERIYVEQASRHLGLRPHYLDAGSYPLLGQWVQTTCPLELYQPRLWFDLERSALTWGRVFLTGDGGDELFSPATVMNAIKSTGAATALVAALRLRLLYGRAPKPGTGLGVLLRRLRRHGRDREPPYPYPDWLNPELERNLNLKQRWAHYWQRRQPPGFEATAGSARAMVTPDWNTDDVFTNCGVTLAERRCPFLDPRLLEFVLSLPALPWLFNKHLLRVAMTDKLPAAILARPKTPLGNVHDSLLAVEKPVFDDSCRPATELSRFVAPGRIEAPAAAAGDSARCYVNLRPFLLDVWLKNLRL